MHILAEICIGKGGGIMSEKGEMIQDVDDLIFEHEDSFPSDR